MDVFRGVENIPTHLRCAIVTIGKDVIIVNDDVEIAAAAGADGVHVGEGDTSVSVARARLGEKAVIGYSTHSIADVHAVNALSVDYVGFGAVFPTATKGVDHPVPGLAGLREAVRVSRHPVVAIGGITAVNLAAVRACGASGYAVLSAITQAADVGAAVRALR